MQESNKLVTQVYWENYYSKASTTRQKIVPICSVYDSFWKLLVRENSEEGKKKIIEIGGHPGRYLAYLADKFQLEPTCLDYNSDRLKIDESMKAFDIKEYHIIQADIMMYKPVAQFDIVISNGFIEHFENFDNILDIHRKFLKPGGTMLIMVPNMRSYIRLYKILVDRDNLRIHNLKCMSKEVFSNFARRSGLKILGLEYFGGFPFSVHQNLNLMQKCVFQLHRILFKKWLDKYVMKYPSKVFSSSLIAVFKA